MSGATATFQTCRRPPVLQVSSFTPARSGRLQRKCACGGFVVQGGLGRPPKGGTTNECQACRQERPSLQPRTAANLGGAERIPPIVDDVLKSSGQSLDSTTRSFMEPRFGHDFSQVRVHTDRQAAASARAFNALAYTVGSDLVFAEGRYEPWTTAGRQLLAHELTHVVQQAKDPAVSRLDRQATDGADANDAETEASLAEEIIIWGQGIDDSPDNLPDTDTDTGAVPLSGGRSACPISEIFLNMVAGAAKANCQVPTGKFGPPTRLAHFRLIGPTGFSTGGLTIDEQFTSLDDPFNVFSALIPQSSVTQANGSFDDCFMVAMPRPLPAGFRLKVEQNHLFNGAVLGKNQITYTSNQISFCHFDRLPGQCGFGGRCKL